jgi:hypothetical protein
MHAALVPFFCFFFLYFLFGFGLRTAAGELRDVHVPLLLSRERACD